MPWRCLARLDMTYFFGSHARDLPLIRSENIKKEAPHPERPNPFGENIRKESRHPERSEGSPDAMEMSRKARHDVLLWEPCEGSPAHQERKYQKSRIPSVLTPRRSPRL